MLRVQESEINQEWIDGVCGHVLRGLTLPVEGVVFQDVEGKVFRLCDACAERETDHE